MKQIDAPCRHQQALTGEPTAGRLEFVGHFGNKRDPGARTRQSRRNSDAEAT